jgi:anti-sigma B factor antagonist
MSNRSFSIDRSDPDVAIVALAGEHETFTAERLRDELAALVEERRAIVIDLSEATFLDSSVVGAILQARAAARDASLRFGVVMDDHTGPSVQRLFELTGLDTVLPIASSRDAALAG